MKGKVLEDTTRIIVKFSELDMMQCVWHGSYITYMEDGRESFGRHYPGIGYADIIASGCYTPVYDLQCKYFAPLQVNDVVLVTTRYVYHPGARLDYEYEMRRERDNALVFRGKTTQLFIDAEGHHLLELPEYYAEWQRRHGFIQ